MLLFVLLPVASASAQSLCTGNVVLLEGGYGIAQFYEMDPVTGALATFYQQTLPENTSPISFGIHNSYLYLQTQQVNGANRTVMRIDLATEEVLSMTTNGFACGEFAFDPELYGEEVAICYGFPATGWASVATLDVENGVFKVVAEYPHISILNSVSGYDPTQHVFYLEMMQNGNQARMVGVSVQTGQVSTNVPIPYAAEFTGPVAIDPLTGLAYITMLYGPEQLAQMALFDLAAGTFSTFGKNFTGPWTQGGAAALISPADRCNLVFSMLLQVSPQAKVTTYLMVNDMATGAVVNQVVLPFSPLASLGYFTRV